MELLKFLENSDQFDMQSVDHIDVTFAINGQTEVFWNTKFTVTWHITQNVSVVS